MEKIIQPGKRKILKAGFCMLSAYGLPVFGKTPSPNDSPLFQILGKRRWVTIQPSTSVGKNAEIGNAGLIQSTGSPVLFWAEANLALIKKYRLNPLRATRALSYLMASLHDAVLSGADRYGTSQPHTSSAIHLTAGNVIEYFFPEEVKGRWVGEAIVAASSFIPQTSPNWSELWEISQEISKKIIARALTDGSARINALAQPPKNIALPWKATPPLWSTRPTEPGAAHWQSWLVSSEVGEQCPAPLTLNEAAYSKAVREVYQTHQNLTPKQKKIAEDWNLDLGTVTPPGVWLLKTMNTPQFPQLSMIEQTGLLSLLTTTMMDALSACWHVKFKWWTERPVTAIRRLYDPAFLPHVLTPSFPSYTSGHATVSGAAAMILSNLLPQYQNEWMQAAEEAAASRLYGGIHFRFDNDEGLALGKKVGQLAILKIKQI